MKKIISTFTFLFSIMITESAYAVLGEANKIPNPLGGSANSLPEFFNAIVGVAIQLGTIVSVLAIMYGGFLYVTAQGNEEQLGKAYKTITWALVGTAILLGSRTIMLAVTGTVADLSTGIN